MVKKTVVFSDNLKKGIVQTSSRLLEDMDDETWKLFNKPKLIAEATLDANRLATFHNKEADEEARKLIEEFGWDRVVRAASHLVVMP